MLLRELGMIRVAAVSPALKVADVVFNLTAIEEATLQAADQGVQLLIFPELAMTGYSCGDLFYQQSLLEKVRDGLTTLTALSEQTGMILIVGAPVRQSGRLFNAAVVMSHGRICGVVPKTYLPNTQEFYEERWFSSAFDLVDDQLAWLDEAPPFGTDLLFDVDGMPDCLFGIEICEDAWVAQRRGAHDGHAMDIIVNPSASHFAFGKHEVRERMVLEGSRSMAVTYLYANLLGNEAGRVIYDGGCYIAQNGKLLAESPRLTFDDSVLTTVVVDVEASRAEQVRTTSFQADSTDPGAKKIAVDFEFPRASMQRSERVMAPWEASKHHKEEELMRSLTLALFDYLRKSHSRGFVLSISGGADSATAACLVSLMVDRGLEVRRCRHRAPV